MAQPAVSPHIVLAEASTYDEYVGAMKAYKRALVRKWRWWLEGVNPKTGESLNMPEVPKHLWEALAIVFENQQLQSTKPGSIFEATTTADVTLPVRFALPIVRLVFPQLLVAKIASIQPLPPMSGGTGQIFYQDFIKEDAAGSPACPSSPPSDWPSDDSIAHMLPDSTYALSEEDAVPKRLKMCIDAVTLTAEKHILAATWSTEVQEDARGALGIDVERELINACAREILQEIDFMVLTEMLNCANAGNATWNWTVPAGYTAKEWYETLFHALVDAEDFIFGARYRSADWIVAGRTLSSYLRKAGNFSPSPDRPPDVFNAGVRYVGSLDGHWDVYTTVFMNTNTGLMGVYPRSQIDTGYVFAPYIPLAPMPLVYADFLPYDDPTLPGAYRNVDKWTRNVRTRNAHKCVVGELFSTITISA